MRASASARTTDSTICTANSAASAMTGAAIAAGGTLPPATSRAVATKRSVASTSSGPIAAPAASVITARVAAASGASWNTIQVPRMNP